MEDPAKLARAILADPRFRPHGKAPKHTPSLLERAWDWLRTIWQHLIDNVARQVHVSTGATNAIGEILLAVLVVFILAVVARLLFSLSRDVPGAQITVLDAAGSRTAAELFAEANDLAAHGAYAKAAATLYRAALALLNERGIVNESVSSTVGDVSRALRKANRSAYGVFSPIAAHFNDAAYAERPLDADAWNDASTSYRRLAESIADA
ncbi:MAG: DUF4129 domain-containing protein [Candidatus Eremiobacteraeota bacterium]|nr:DUF4129 domain-containing protein [Candidatus Eremiobacteraeota bacterium]